MPGPQAPLAPATPATAPPKPPWLPLAAILLAVFVVPMSISGTAVALPGIGADTGAGPAPLQWVVNAFNVAFACFTLVWGSVADIVGRVRAFAAGAAVYAVASLASALASDVLLLDAARALAGIGGAAIFSCGSAILSTVYEGPARAKAFALFGTVAGVGIAVGPSLSGALLQTVSWRWSSPCTRWPSPSSWPRYRPSPARSRPRPVRPARVSTYPAAPSSSSPWCC